METIEIDGVILSFEKLTTGQEKEYAEETHRLIMSGARRSADAMDLQGMEKAEYLAAVEARSPLSKCGLLSPLGAEHAFTPEGLARLLRLASRKHHPDPPIDDTTLLRVITEKQEDAMRVIAAVYPGNVQKKIQAAMAKASGRTDTLAGT